MKKLFAVYLGGRADGCNIELHDVVFVIGESIEETYPTLAKKWFGNMQHFHIDSYQHLNYVDGYEIELVKEPPQNQKKLYFINLGAYKPFEFTEYHQSSFYVVDSAPEAVKRAKAELCQGLETIHKDDVILLESARLDYDVDDVLEVSKVDNCFVSLKPSSGSLSKPVSAYIPLQEIVKNIRT